VSLLDLFWLLRRSLSEIRLAVDFRAWWRGKAPIRAATGSQKATSTTSTDTGFTAEGDFIDGVPHPAGMLLHRERQAARG